MARRPMSTHVRALRAATAFEERRAGPEVDFGALADLVSAPSSEVADRAHAALAPVLAHDALVLVAPNAPGLPVQIAAPPELHGRLASFDWSMLVHAELPQPGGAARLALPDLSGGVRLGGWIALVEDVSVALILGAQGPLSIGAAEERAATQVALLAAARACGLDRDPSPGTLAFAHAISQERERVRSELRSRHSATLSSLLHTLRRASEGNGSRAAPPEVIEAIGVASQGLLELRAAAKRQETSLYVTVTAAFADAEAELRGIVRAGNLQPVIGLEAGGDERLPRAIAQAARIVTRAGALNATNHNGATKLRVQWRLSDEALTVIVADDGGGFSRDADRPRREVAYMRRRVAGLRGTVELDTAPDWGSSITCTLPLHGPPLAPETPAAERIAHLRARECEVLELMVAGLSNRDIAERLFITVRTVKFHVSNILRKLDVASRTEAIALAHAAGVSPPDET